MSRTPSIEAKARQQVGALSDDERLLCQKVVASLKNSIQDEFKYHLDSTYPEMDVTLERWIFLECVIRDKLDTLL